MSNSTESYRNLKGEVIEQREVNRALRAIAERLTRYLPQDQVEMVVEAQRAVDAAKANLDHALNAVTTEIQKSRY